MQHAVTFFSFPLNLILALLWTGSMLWLWKSRRKSPLVRFMLSKAATISAISLLLTFCLIMGFTGLGAPVYSWAFIIVLFYFQTVLFFVLVRGGRQFIRHVGLFIAVSSAFWGAPDSETYRMKAVRDIPVREAFRMDGSAVHLSYAVELKDFRTETWDNGVPSMYEADVIIDNEDVTLRVNHPYSLGFGEDVYLSGAGDGSGYCVLQIVREPWKYGALVGIVLMLAGAFLLFIEGPRGHKMMED